MAISPRKPFYRDVIWWFLVVLAVVVIYKVVTLDIGNIKAYKLDTVSKQHHRLDEGMHNAK